MPMYRTPTYRTPGVHREDITLPLAAGLQTGVPVFLGLVAQPAIQAFPDGLSLSELSPGGGLWLVKKAGTDVSSREPDRFTRWPEFESAFGAIRGAGYLVPAVRGFFDNGGSACYVLMICCDEGFSRIVALRQGLALLEAFEEADLVCVPDIMWPATGAAKPDLADVRVMQADLLDHCDREGDRMAILDSLQDASVTDVLAQRGGLTGINGALYYPWIKTPDGPAFTDGFVPPCGHVAGVYARTDRQTGIHKAPANELLEDVLDLAADLTDADQGQLNPEGVNCLRAFPGRGIRVWGARTVSADPAWKYVSVRRLFLTAGRWIERNMAEVAWEPHAPGLWARIDRALTAYFDDLFRRGALMGRTAAEAFYVKCDAESNPPEVRDAGIVVAEIGLAPTSPSEFVVVRVIHRASGVTITTAPVGELVTPAAVRIVAIDYQPAGDDPLRESVLLQNRGGMAQELAGWTLSDLAGHAYVFPSSRLAAGGSLRVWTGPGMDAAANLYWGRDAAVWTNIGDRARLRDAWGALVDEYVYHALDELLAKAARSKI